MPAPARVTSPVGASPEPAFTPTVTVAVFPTMTVSSPPAVTVVDAGMIVRVPDAVPEWSGSFTVTATP
ncbi:MAG: hypothetical protein WAT55_14385 [Candidatus Microthrix parvicella]|nr:hypothetical protein [Candidatus Microthrix sp.]